MFNLRCIELLCLSPLRYTELVGLVGGGKGKNESIMLQIRGRKAQACWCRLAAVSYCVVFWPPAWMVCLLLLVAAALSCRAPLTELIQHQGAASTGAMIITTVELINDIINMIS